MTKRLLPGLVWLVFPVLIPAGAFQDDPRASALARFKVAIETGNIKELAPLVAGRPGQILRRLADPYARLQAANERLEAALAERGITLENPFASVAQPLEDCHLEVLEITQEAGKPCARVRFGPRGRGAEELLALVEEEGTWRVTLPSALGNDLEKDAGQVPVEQRARQLARLADLLETLAQELATGKLKTRDEVLLRLLRLYREKMPAEGPGTPAPPASRS
jgi:hypothetical protein